MVIDNQMKANPDRCHCICSTNDTVNLTVENQVIGNGTYEKLFGVKLDYKLTSNAHIDDICKKSGLKLNGLSRIAPYTGFKKTVFSECVLYVSIQILSFDLNVS